MSDKDEVIRRSGMEKYGFGTEAMKKIKVCEKCGASNDADAVYCGFCGALLPKKTLFESYKERHRLCPYCDANLPDEGDYCPQCGKKLP